MKREGDPHIPLVAGCLVAWFVIMLVVALALPKVSCVAGRHMVAMPHGGALCVRD